MTAQPNQESPIPSSIATSSEPFFKGVSQPLHGRIDQFFLPAIDADFRRAGLEDTLWLAISCLEEGSDKWQGNYVSIPLLCPYCGDSYHANDDLIASLNDVLHQAKARALNWLCLKSGLVRDEQLPFCASLPEDIHPFGMVINGIGVFANQRTLIRFPSCKNRSAPPDGSDLVLGLFPSACRRDARGVYAQTPEPQYLGLIVTHPASLFHIEFADRWPDDLLERVREDIRGGIG